MSVTLTRNIDCSSIWGNSGAVATCTLYPAINSSAELNMECPDASCAPGTRAHAAHSSAIAATPRTRADPGAFPRFPAGFVIILWDRLQKL